MESKVEETVDISDIARNDNHDGFDFRKQLLQAVQNEWAKASTNNLEKKKKQKKIIMLVRNVSAIFDLLMC